MEIDFHDNYIFAVLVFMIFVWFARNCLDCLQALFNCLDRCDLSCCCGVQCIGYDAQYCLMMGVKESLKIMFDLEADLEEWGLGEALEAGNSERAVGIPE